MPPGVWCVPMAATLESGFRSGTRLNWDLAICWGRTRATLTFADPEAAMPRSMKPLFVVATVAVIVLMPALAPSPATAAHVAPVGVGSYAKVHWATVAYPRLGCGTGSTATATGVRFGVDVLQVSYLEDAPGRHLAIVLVKCAAGSPTPSALYAFDAVTKGRPHLRSVLLAPPNPRSPTIWSATAFTTTRTGVAMDALGVTGSAPICCPNEAATMRWKWTGAGFQRHVTAQPYSTPTTTTTTVPLSVEDCTAGQLVGQYEGGQGAVGNWAANFAIANAGSAPCAIRSTTVSVELLNGLGASRTTPPADVFAPILLSDHGSFPPPSQNPAPGLMLASLVLAWPTIPNGILSLGGTGNTCPQPLFVAQTAVIRLTGLQPLVVANLIAPDPGTSPPTLCGPDLNIWAFGPSPS